MSQDYLTTNASTIPCHKELCFSCNHRRELCYFIYAALPFQGSFLSYYKSGHDFQWCMTFIISCWLILIKCVIIYEVSPLLSLWNYWFFSSWWPSISPLKSLDFFFFFPKRYLCAWIYLFILKSLDYSRFLSFEAPPPLFYCCFHLDSLSLHHCALYSLSKECSFFSDLYTVDVFSYLKSLLTSKLTFLSFSA